MQVRASAMFVSTGSMAIFASVYIQNGHPNFSYFSYPTGEKKALN